MKKSVQLEPPLQHRENPRIRKMKKFLAWAGLLILACIYLATFILGLFGSPATKNLLLACIILTIVVPVIFWAMIRTANWLEGRGDTEERDA